MHSAAKPCYTCSAAVCASRFLLDCGPISSKTVSDYGKFELAALHAAWQSLPDMQLNNFFRAMHELS